MRLSKGSVTLWLCGLSKWWFTTVTESQSCIVPRTEASGRGGRLARRVSRSASAVSGAVEEARRIESLGKGEAYASRRRSFDRRGSRYSCDTGGQPQV